MIIAILIVFGLCLGSFVNALVWRLHQQSKKGAKHNKELSILKGRSMCPHCKHELAARDLIPVLSWLGLKGKCRYCHKAISAQYPLVELVTAGLFIASYIWWPNDLKGLQIAIFVLWLKLLVGLVDLTVYDLKWFLLPNRIVYPCSLVALLISILNIVDASGPLMALINVVLAVLVGGGIFYILFQVSKGKWIGGGDVKLGFMLGLVAGTPARSLLFIFLAAVAGSLISLPLLYSHRLKRTSLIPFGPFLIAGAVVVQLFGANILHWYSHAFLNI